METKDYSYMGELTLRRFHDNSWQVIQNNHTLKCLPSNTAYKTAKRMVREMISKNEISLTPLLKCNACSAAGMVSTTEGWKFPYQEGINPMYANKTTATSTDVSLNFQAAKSDAMNGREYLLKEFDNITRYSFRDDTYSKLRKMFNIDAPTLPRTSQEIIDAFKNGRVEIDQAKVDKQTAWFKARENDEDFDFNDEDYNDASDRHISDRYFGVKFIDLPVEDRKGFDAAVAAYEKLKTDTRRKLAILEPEAGLEVLTAFEAWSPTPATDTVH